MESTGIFSLAFFQSMITHYLHISVQKLRNKLLVPKLFLVIFFSSNVKHKRRTRYYHPREIWEFWNHLAVINEIAGVRLNEENSKYWNTPFTQQRYPPIFANTRTTHLTGRGGRIRSWAGELYSLEGGTARGSEGRGEGRGGNEKVYPKLYSSLNGPSKSPLPFRFARTIYLRGAGTRSLFIAVN